MRDFKKSLVKLNKEQSEILELINHGNEEEIQKKWKKSTRDIMHFYGRRNVNELQKSIKTIINNLNFPTQNIRVIIKLLGIETSDIFNLTTMKVEIKDARILDAIWDSKSWDEVDLASQNTGHIPHGVYDSTALLSLIMGDKWYIINDTRTDINYKSAPKIYENGFYAKLALPIKDGGITFGAIIVLLENKESHEIFINRHDSFLLFTSLFSVDLLAILMEQIHFFDTKIEAKIKQHTNK